MVKVVPFRSQKCLVPLTYFFQKGPPKRGVLEICLTMFFGVSNFKNTSGIKIIFFLKTGKI